MSVAEDLVEDLLPIDGMGNGAPQRLALELTLAMVDGEEINAAIVHGRRHEHAGERCHFLDSLSRQIEQEVQSALLVGLKFLPWLLGNHEMDFPDSRQTDLAFAVGIILIGDKYHFVLALRLELERPA